MEGYITVPAVIVGWFAFFFFFWEICCANFTSQVVRKSIINLFLAFDKSIQSEIFTGIVAMKQLFYRILLQSRPWPRQRTEDLMSEGLITVLLVGWGKINYSNTAIFAQRQHTWTENTICNLCQKNCWVFFFSFFLVCNLNHYAVLTMQLYCALMSENTDSKAMLGIITLLKNAASHSNTCKYLGVLR